MKIVIDRSQLIEALAIVGRVVPSRSHVPAALCVLLKTGDRVLTVTGAGNGDMAARVEVAAVDILEPGEVLVDFDRLRRLATALDSQSLRMESDKDKVTVTTESGSYSLFTYDPKDALALATPSDEERENASFTIDGKALVEALARVIRTVGRESSRYSFAGVYFKREGKRLELVATDGRRLTVMNLSLAKTGTVRTAIVPSATFPVLTAAVTQECEARVTLGETRVEFNIDKGRVVLTSAIIEGAFVPYSDVIPKNQPRSVRVKREALAAATRRAIPFTAEGSRAVRLSFVEKKKSLAVAARGVDLGEGSTTVTLDDCAGGDIDIGFNPQFLLDALEATGGDVVHITLDTKEKPAVFHAESFVCCVMPINVLA